MKMKFHNLVGDDVRSLTSSGSPKRFGDSLPRPLRSQRGVALIITVILLSVLTLMTLAFLAMSRRERGAVTTTTDTASARLAADAALANAEAQIVANALATTNPYNFGLIVSTNYLPHTNGIYPDDLTNLFISPRTLVWLSNTVTHAMENRFYLDLNRNGRFDPNGMVTNYDNAGNVLKDASGNVITNFQVGDPEWIGVLQHPDQPYGPNNPFVARFAFIAVPVGNTLDLNAIHNQAFTRSVANINNDGFLRNQGVGSWEINLAAFLADLNTNQWGQIIGNTFNGNTTFYYYQYPPSGINQGAAFNDAFSILSYRYNNNYFSLLPASLLFANNGLMFENDNIDGYSDGPLQEGFSLPVDNDDPSLPWAGADNTNHFFTHQELFNSNEISPTFVNRLLAAGNTNSTYDRYTFYRLLSQLGTDSTPEQNKMNLNYSNAVAYFDANGIVTNIIIIPGAETNFIPWTPIQFFTIAADKMLRAYSQEWLTESPTNYVATYYGTNNYDLLLANPSLITNYPAFGITSRRCASTRF